MPKHLKPQAKFFIHGSEHPLQTVQHKVKPFKAMRITMQQPPKVAMLQGVIEFVTYGSDSRAHPLYMVSGNGAVQTYVVNVEDGLPPQKYIFSYLHAGQTVMVETFDQHLEWEAPEVAATMTMLTEEQKEKLFEEKGVRPLKK